MVWGKMSRKRSHRESEQQVNICDHLRHRLLILLKQQNLCAEASIHTKTKEL
ncbi:hypothetical protein [Nostoc sp. FACHB-888]|uniref:hypothetical protein n=1 Tax=Nostoc sp. FACHB-888 TaxID=2692842 RepID=UPI001685FC93|nr:hypothetical protein [Nostoc sp. FACHB-888]MBD2245949.1 hypothetical protein [Nostoc sp. FACHB-888]